MRLIDADALASTIKNVSKACDGLERIMAEATLKVVLETPTVETIFGCRVNDLIVFAMACQKCGIEDRDLRKFALDAESAFEFVKLYEQEMIENAIKYSVAKSAEDINVLCKRRSNDA